MSVLCFDILQQPFSVSFKIERSEGKYHAKWRLANEHWDDDIVGKVDLTVWKKKEKESMAAKDAVKADKYLTTETKISRVSPTSELTLDIPVELKRLLKYFRETQFAPTVTIYLDTVIGTDEDLRQFIFQYALIDEVASDKSKASSYYYKFHYCAAQFDMYVKEFKIPEGNELAFSGLDL